jgi:hypothetical protein
MQIRTKVNILKEKKILKLAKKIWFCVCLVTANIFEHRSSGENRSKRSEVFFDN